MRAKRDLCLTLSLDTFRRVSSLPTVHHIWERLKELYSCDVDQTHSMQTTIISEFGSFQRKSRETINQVASRFNHLLIVMLTYKLKRELIEERVIFMNNLHSE